MADEINEVVNTANTVVSAADNEAGAPVKAGMVKAGMACEGARVIAVANQKGGVGKTTTALTLGAALSRMGKQVLLVDLDPHICASIHLRFYPDEQEATVYDIFQAQEDKWPYLWTRVIKTQGGQGADTAAGAGLSMAPGHVRLSELEADLQSRPRKGFIMREALVPLAGKYDYIILDCPPHLGILLVNALVASNLLIMPIQTDFLALHGLKLIFDTMRTLNKALPTPINYRALPTMYDKRARACNNVLMLLQRKMGDYVFKAIVPLDTQFREASAQGTVIFELDAASRGARAYMDLAKEVADLW